MAESKKGKNKKKGGGARSTALVGLLAVVAVIAAWLSNCIPGFGIGADGSADGEKAEQAAPATPEEAEEAKQVEKEAEAKQEGDEAGSPSKEDQDTPPKPEVGETGPLLIKMDARGCFTEAEPEPRDCAEVCKQDALGGGRKIQIDPTDAPHSMVTEFLDCLKTEHGEVQVAVTRDE